MDSAYADSCFQLADVQQKGFISGAEAVSFFSKSGLEKTILRQIWAVSDSRQSGQLNRMEFHFALRLIAMAQMGERDLTRERLSNLGNANIPLARFQGVPLPQQQPQQPQPSQFMTTTSASQQQQPMTITIVP